METTTGNGTKVKDDEVVPIPAPVEKPVAPTFGRAILLLSGSLNFGVAVGLPISLSVMFLEWQETFKTSRALTASIHSTCVGILFGGGIVAGYMMKRYGTRTTLTLGSALASIGLFLALFAPNVETMIASVGVVAGCGFCLLQLPCIPCSTLPFPKHQSLAIAACLLGGSVIGGVLPYLFKYLINEYSWRGAFFILSALALNTLVLDLIMTSSVGKNPRSHGAASSYETKNLMADADIEPSDVPLSACASSDNGTSEKEVTVLNCQSGEEKSNEHQKNGSEIKMINNVHIGGCRTVDAKHSEPGVIYNTNGSNKVVIKSNEHCHVTEEQTEYDGLISNCHEEETSRDDDTCQDSNIATTSIDLSTGVSTATHSLENYKPSLFANSGNVYDNSRHYVEDVYKNSPTYTRISPNESAPIDADNLQDKTVIKSDGNVCSVQLSKQAGILHRLRLSPWRFLLDALSQGVMLVLAIDLGSLFSTVLLLMDISKTKGFPDLGVTLIQLTFFTSLAAKVITGALGMWRNLSSYLLLALCGAGGGGSALLIAFSQQEIGLIAGASGLGFFLGGIVTVYPKCFLDSPAIDEINYPLAFGVGNTCEGITDFLFPILIGYMADRSGAYTLPLSLVGVSSILCAIILVLVYFWTRRKVKDKGNQNGS